MSTKHKQANVRAEHGGLSGGHPCWLGQYRVGKLWRTVRDVSGKPIAYHTPEDAIAGAEVFRERAA